MFNIKLKWFCPDCRTHLNRFGDVKRRTKDLGMYQLISHFCLECGSPNAIPFESYLKRKMSEGKI